MIRTLCFSLVLLAGVTLTAETPDGESIAGRYRLEADGRLIARSLDLEFYRSADPPDSADERLPPSLSGIWNARVVSLPNLTETSAPAFCALCPEPLNGKLLPGLTILHGLRERPAGSGREFLYGRLYLTLQPRPLRCKVWRTPNGRDLLLRIYEDGPSATQRYSTHRLRALAD